MTEQELKQAKEKLSNCSVDIEKWGGGYMISDYSGVIPSRFGAKYCGADMNWNDQPRCDVPFDTEESAVKYALGLNRPKRNGDDL